MNWNAVVELASPHLMRRKPGFNNPKLEMMLLVAGLDLGVTSEDRALLPGDLLVPYRRPCRGNTSHKIIDATFDEQTSGKMFYPVFYPHDSSILPTMKNTLQNSVLDTVLGEKFGAP